VPSSLCVTSFLLVMGSKSSCGFLSFSSGIDCLSGFTEGEAHDTQALFELNSLAFTGFLENSAQAVQGQRGVLNLVAGGLFTKWATCG